MECHDLCSHSPDMVEFTCNGRSFPMLSRQQINSMVTVGEVGRGFENTAYRVLIGSKEAVAKSGVSDRENALRESCMQQTAYEYKLAPQILGIWLCSGRSVIAMEYVRGESLVNVMRNTVDPYAVLYTCVLSVLRLNLLAHIRHNDLHGDNIIVRDGIPQFIDFGISFPFDIREMTEIVSKGIYTGSDVRISPWVSDLQMIGYTIFKLAQSRFREGQTFTGFCHQIAKGDVLDQITLFNIFTRFYAIHHRLPSPDETLVEYKKLLLK